MNVNKRLSLFLVPIVAACLLSWPAGIEAQKPAVEMGGLVLTGSAGGAAFSDLQRTPARAHWLTATGVIESRDFERRLSPATSVAFAASAAYWLNARWGVRVGAGWAPSRLEVTVSERETAAIPADTMVEGERLSKLSVWVNDAALILRLPFTPRGRVAPYAFIGGGALQYSARGPDPLPPEAESSFADGAAPRRVAAVLGVAAMVPLQRRNLAFSFELTDHIARTPIGESAGGEMEDATVRVTLTSDETPSSNGRVKTTSHIRLLVGLSWFPR